MDKTNKNHSLTNKRCKVCNKIIFTKFDICDNCWGEYPDDDLTTPMYNGMFYACANTDKDYHKG
jgi:hypothetical protein